MAKAKKSKAKGNSKAAAVNSGSTATASYLDSSGGGATTTGTSGTKHHGLNGSSSASNNNNNGGHTTPLPPPPPTSSSFSSSATTTNLDDLQWLRDCDARRDPDGEAFLQLEYQDDDELVILLHEFLQTSAATKQVIDDLYQIWQHTVLSTLLASSALWKKEIVQTGDQRIMKDHLKTSRYKINFLMHHAVGSMLSSTDPKWRARHTDLLELCYNTLQLLPRLAESCPHHKTDVRQAIVHFEGKEFLASVACETWDTLYDYSIPIDPDRFVPILRRCAMLDILDKDWNMLGGWEDILKGLETKCCAGMPAGSGGGTTTNDSSVIGSVAAAATVTGSNYVLRLPCDPLLHEHTTILRNARNSMQCKFFSVRFMRYTEDQAPQRWRYFPKCSAPACANLETPATPHPYRCQQCWYFHYCSESCQEYCDSIMGLHPKFCRDTPATKAAQCRHETHSYLGWPVSFDTGGPPVVLTCRACGASEHHVTDMKRCSKCQSVYYCTRQCQEWDWRVGGHRAYCKKALPTTTTTIHPTAATTTTMNGSGGGVAASLVGSSNGSAGPIKDLN